MSKFDISQASRNDLMLDHIQAILKEVDNLKSYTSNLEAAMIVLSNENTIKIWEDFFELKQENSWTLQDRIKRVLYTFNSRSFFTRSLVNELALIFGPQGEVQIIEDFPNYHFTVQMVSDIGVPNNFQDFYDMLYLNKSAKLTFDILFRYRTHNELKPYLHNTLHNYTHEELRSRATITV